MVILVGNTTKAITRIRRYGNLRLPSSVNNDTTSKGDVITHSSNSVSEGIAMYTHTKTV